MTVSKTSENIALPVLQKRKHNTTRWIVLISVQALIIAHIVVWILGKKYGWFGGVTLTPIEPSEGMEFVKNGVINAGTIFFALALLSTLIFGRWFCGWGCHIVLLQDCCLWMMRKISVRPKPFRARWLMWFPFGLAVYMFIWPLFYRVALAPWLQPELRWPEITTHLLTDDYWGSFAPPLVAVPFLFICGFATVYVLGAKGFCSYGCPYGGFFKPLDAISPMRVRVNDDCQQCGACTAACTSNVRVHEEVHLHKMVIDSGCMKIMDCIDACPNDALSIGFGENSVGKRTKQRKYDLTMLEELGVSIFFLVGFFSFRGLYGVVPMLMAVGMSLVSTWLVWKALQVLTSKNASFHKTQLRFHGKYKIGSVLFLIIAVLVFLFTIQSGLVRTCRALGDVAMANDKSEKALGYYQLAGPMSDGGIGFASNPNIDTVMARIHETKGEFQEAQRLLWRVDGKIGPDEYSTMLLGQLLQYDQQAQLLDSFYSERLSENENWELVWEDYVGWLKREGMYERAIAASKVAVIRNPLVVRLQIQLALLEIDFGDVQHAISIAISLTKTHPMESTSWKLLARSLDKVGDRIGAGEAMRKAAELQ